MCMVIWAEHTKRTVISTGLSRLRKSNDARWAICYCLFACWRHLQSETGCSGDFIFSTRRCSSKHSGTPRAWPRLPATRLLSKRLGNLPMHDLQFQEALDTARATGNEPQQLLFLIESQTSRLPTARLQTRRNTQDKLSSLPASVAWKTSPPAD